MNKESRFSYSGVSSKTASPNKSVANGKRPSLKSIDGADTACSRRNSDSLTRTEGERVRVFVRVRPTKPEETAGGLKMKSSGKGVVVYREHASIPVSDWEFDKVLPPTASQSDVYQTAVKPIVEDVLNGYNGTVMAYGQTGAGKTFTLSSIKPDAIGMVPRAAAEIFSSMATDKSHEYTIYLSYIQIYMELIQDLLRPESENLQIRENEGGVFISGVQQVEVNNIERCLHLLQLGDRNRATAFTALNAHSSRSHAVVMLTVFKRKSVAGSGDAEIQRVKMGKLFMVDLAGSERLKKSKSTGLRATEAKSINLSLTTLGMCINARADPNATHVPFRDSKLTRLLQESLGGNAKTSLVIAVSDAVDHVDETMQSLQFGVRAMCVKIQAVVNERVDYKTLHADLIAAMEGQDHRSALLEKSLLAKETELESMHAQLRGEKEANERVVAELQREREAAEAEKDRQLQEQEARLAEEQQCKQTLLQQLEEAQALRDSLKEQHEQEQASLAAQHEQERASLAAQHEQERATLAEQVKQRDAKLEEAALAAKEAQLQHELAMDELRVEHKRNQERLREAHEAARQRASEEHKQRIQHAEEQHASEVAALQQEVDSREQRLGDLQEQLEQVLAASQADKQQAQEHLAQRDARIAELEDNVASRDDAIVQLNDTISELEASQEQLRDERQQLHRTVDLLEQQCQDLEASLAQDRDHIGSLERQLEAYERSRMNLAKSFFENRRLENAARVIQRAYRAHRNLRMKEAQQRKQQALNDAQHALGSLEQQHAELARRRRANLAFSGQTLVGDSLGVLQEAVEGLITAFLLPAKDLRTLQSMKQRVSQYGGKNPLLASMQQQPSLSRTSTNPDLIRAVNPLAASVASFAGSDEGSVRGGGLSRMFSLTSASFRKQQQQQQGPHHDPLHTPRQDQQMHFPQLQQRSPLSGLALGLGLRSNR